CARRTLQLGHYFDYW
nr:immunoglobulin heavy chain junction region [Macaca mulatta]MOW98929.1 immunoglobulin heavy chain junction region [Macaca mulatta]MOW99402.1 immunoglobulin heavy chain junction region [Macaca mulatta]MOX00055.1 immunoglobulin heavy chain junction region [Macaca mulatta]MOX00299.1 immunoglobulin heavy chain junction region [Macaca mulatta]